MRSRDPLMRRFLEARGWTDAEVADLAGDASNRRYLRLSHPDLGRAVLMDAPPQKGEDVRPFIRIATHLGGLGLSAPSIIAADTEAGFLLLEDLGDDLFAKVIPRSPELEKPLYETATDVLLRLHEAPLPPGISAYTPALMTEMAALAFDWYLGQAEAANAEARGAFAAAMLPLLEEHCADQDVLTQRDYHAENLLWLPTREGTARVGLLDFQDAMAGHRAYDLVSLLQDARRDVPEEIEREMIDRYIARSASGEQEFHLAYHLLGAQRNLRILGVFARLCTRDGKAHYVDLIPRVWSLLRRDLSHPGLKPLRSRLRVLPEPTTDILERLKSKCATVPMH